MKVAFVGGHGSELDFNVLVDALVLIPAIKGAKVDFIDLRYGRDFLKEKHEYDVVILCYIFQMTQEEHSRDPLYKLTKNNPTYKTSPLHSEENWRKRLESTGAQEILIFGYDTRSEVTGEYVGTLPGYEQSVSTDQYGSVWRLRKELDHEDCRRQSSEAVQA